MSSHSSGVGAAGSTGAGSSVDSTGIKVSVTPVDRATVARKLSVGSTLTARIIEAHGGGRYTVGFAGLRLIAESSLQLAPGARLPAQVMALEPKVHLKILDPQGDGGLDRILHRNGINKPTPELRELVAGLMERGLPIDRNTLQRGIGGMNNGLSPKEAARFVAAESAVTEASIARARAGERSVAGALDRLVRALSAEGRGSEAAAVKEAVTFRGDLAELFRRHPLGAERRALAREPEIASRSSDLPRVLDDLSSATGKNAAEIRRAAVDLKTALAGPNTLENAAALSRSLGALTRALADAGRGADVAILREALLDPSIARSLDRAGGELTTEAARRVLAEARLLLSDLGRPRPDAALARVDPELARLANDPARRFESDGYLKDPDLKSGLERLAERLREQGNEGAALRIRALLAEVASASPLSSRAFEAQLAKELAPHLQDAKALLVGLSRESDGLSEIPRAARDFLDALEGHFLFGDPESHIPFVVEDEGMQDAFIRAERSNERTYVRFRLDTSRLGPVVGVMDFHRRAFGMALGVTKDESRKEIRAALPELNRSMEAFGFHLDSVTVDKRADETAAREVPVLGLDIKA